MTRRLSCGCYRTIPFQLWMGNEKLESLPSNKPKLYIRIKLAPLLTDWNVQRGLGFILFGFRRFGDIQTFSFHRHLEEMGLRNV